MNEFNLVIGPIIILVKDVVFPINANHTGSLIGQLEHFANCILSFNYFVTFLFHFFKTRFYAAVCCPAFAHYNIPLKSTLMAVHEV